MELVFVSCFVFQLFSLVVWTGGGLTVLEGKWETAKPQIQAPIRGKLKFTLVLSAKSSIQVPCPVFDTYPFVKLPRLLGQSEFKTCFEDGVS